MPQTQFTQSVLIKEKGKICGNCGSQNNIQYHHVIPLAIGGNDVLTNIIPLCEECHNLVHSKTSTNHSELTKKGIEKARLAGKQIGLKKGTKLNTQKSILSKQYILDNSKDFNGTLTDIEIIKQLSLSRNSFYKYKKELKEEKIRG